MSEINAHNVHIRVAYIQSVYRESDRVFEMFMQPIAAYDKDGKIVKASRDFRKLSGITEEDIRTRSADIFDCLNNENAGITEAARSVFDEKYTEKIVNNLVCPLLPKTEVAKKLLDKFKSAVFFPMSHIEGSVEYGGVLLMEEEKMDSG